MPQRNQWPTTQRHCCCEKYIVTTSLLSTLHQHQSPPGLSPHTHTHTHTHTQAQISNISSGLFVWSLESLLHTIHVAPHKPAETNSLRINRGTFTIDRHHTSINSVECADTGQNRQMFVGSIDPVNQTDPCRLRDDEILQCLLTKTIPTLTHTEQTAKHTSNIRQTIRRSVPNIPNDPS